jgi:hypothetical protein
MARAAQTVDLPPLCFRAELLSVDVESRTVDLVFTTGAGVERYDYNSGRRYLEVLSMDPKHVRLDRLNQAGPLLDSHSAWSVGDVFGAIVEGSARMEKGRGLGKVKFSRRPDVEPYFQDVVDGVLRAVSIGYRVHKFLEDAGKDNKLPVRTAIDWEPYEVSLVPMPADVGARVRSGDKSLLNPCLVLRTAGDDADRLRRFRLAQARF